MREYRPKMVCSQEQLFFLHEGLETLKQTPWEKADEILSKYFREFGDGGETSEHYGEVALLPGEDLKGFEDEDLTSECLEDDISLPGEEVEEVLA
jgi:hypothetical protein